MLARKIEAWRGWESQRREGDGLTEREERANKLHRSWLEPSSRLFSWTRSQTRRYSVTLGGMSYAGKSVKIKYQRPQKICSSRFILSSKSFALDYTFYSKFFHLYPDLAFLSLVQVVLSLLQVCNLLSSTAMVLIRGSPVLRDVLETCVCRRLFYGCPMIKGSPGI